ncbi:MAG: phosphoribosylanthranilate isomerase [Leptolyngbyaceae cyanobacterium]
MLSIDSSLWVKICGLTQVEQAVAIARLGASAIGFICVRSSPRYVTPLQIQAMSQALLADAHDEVERVGVFVNADWDTLDEAIAIGQLTTLQLHGQESQATCIKVRHTYPDLKVIKAFRIRSKADLGSIAIYEDVVDALLLDAYHPRQLGGTGKTLPWQSLQHLQPSKPWILAGGLNPENVEQALAMLSPQGIDLSSSIETSPGNKSMEKAQRLFATLKNPVPRRNRVPKFPRR